MKLTPFQQRTADYAFDRLWDDRSPAYRFLVADEVGLGKTIVARDIVRQTLEQFPRGRVDILYVCSNQRIAAQNLSKLVIGGKGVTAKGTRLSLMALGDAKAEGGAQRVRYHAITPDTSFKLGSGAGSVRERALVYVALKRAWRWHGLSDLLRERAGERTWRDQVASIPIAQPDQAILDAFRTATLADEALTAQVRDLAGRARRGESDKAFRKARSAAIGQLRAGLAAAGVQAVAPTSLIIVDEFQKFPELLRRPNDPPTLAQTLAARLFKAGDPKRRILLLSATPYRLPGVGSGPGEKPYDGFIDLIRFMTGDRDADRLTLALSEFSAALTAPLPEASRVEMARSQAQAILRRVMTRTERVSWTPNADSMVAERILPLETDVEDLRGGVAARQAARLLHAQDPLEYWKSAPYFLDFMRDYKFRTVATATTGKTRRALSALAKDRLLLDQRNLRRLKPTTPPNARLRHLIEDALPNKAEQLLWVPPSLPYLQPAGVFASGRPDLKRLVFSEWRLAPDAIAALTSYEAERRLAAAHAPKVQRGRTRAKGDPNRAHADFAKHGELLRLTRSGGSRIPTAALHPPALALLVPSETLARIGDPLAFALAAGGPVTARLALGRVRTALRHQLSKLPRGRSTGRVDERWYWAAPLLLDQAVSRTWLAMKDPLGQRLETGVDLDLVQGMAAVVAHPERLGPRPGDLEEVLAFLALAGPAVCAERALKRTIVGAHPAGELSRCAFHVARGFQSLFNQADATLAVQSGRYREPAYWRKVVRYCLDGNLQALLDEQLHLTADGLSLFDGTLSQKLEKAARSLFEVLTLRRAVVEVSGLERRRGRSRTVERLPLRCRHALRFAEIKEADGQVSRLDTVRSAFNSPFRPFILASTTLGQEGLDFHPWCHAVVHWNLPRSPVELEQREGRVHRYKGQAVRLNVATAVGLSGLTVAGHAHGDDPWAAMFAQAATLVPENELAPAWLFEQGPTPHRIQRIVPFPSMSREAELWEQLQGRLGLYRLVMGLPRQEELVSALEGQISVEQARAWTIDLRPPRRRNGN